MIPTEDEILSFVKNNRCNYSRLLPIAYHEWYNKSLKFLNGRSNAEKLYRWIHRFNGVGKCKQCGEKTKFRNFDMGFSIFCSTKCSNSNKDTKTKKEKKCLNHYGVKNPSQSSEIKNKKKESCLQKYGVNCNLMLDETKEKIKRCCSEKYGTSVYTQSESYRNSRNKSYFNKLFKTNRLNNKVTPMFSLEEFKGTETKNKYQFKCNVCGHLFLDHLDNGRIPRCYRCHPFQYQSKYESEIHSFLKSLNLNLKIIQKNRSLLDNKFEIDFYIPSRKLAIEFDGLFWHSESGGGKNKTYHLNKTKMCKEQGIKLIHIFENEWLEKRNIIENKLKQMLISHQLDVSGENYYIKHISKEESHSFINKNYLFGYRKSEQELGLFFREKLISVMTLKKTDCENWEIVRFCSQLEENFSFEKLLNFFITKYKPQNIIVFEDNRWPSSLIYEKLGFVLLNRTEPNCYYIDEKYQKLFENKEDVKYRDIIWDCGKSVYEKIPTII